MNHSVRPNAVMVLGPFLAIAFAAISLYLKGQMTEKSSKLPVSMLTKGCNHAQE